jgi:hypothetical protein
MSAYVTLTTAMVDQECLLEALAKMGFNRSVIEISSEPVLLRGPRIRKANILIRREHLNPSWEDIGFLKTSVGYQATVSADSRSPYGKEWLARVLLAYEAKYAEKQARLEREAREAEIEARRKAEAERIRMEEERRRLIEAQRLAVHEKAKKMGYQIKETREGETLRLVLVKRTY